MKGKVPVQFLLNASDAREVDRLVTSGRYPTKVAVYRTAITQLIQKEKQHV